MRSSMERPSSARSPWCSAATSAPRLPALATMSGRANARPASRARAVAVDTSQCGWTTAMNRPSGTGSRTELERVVAADEHDAAERWPGPRCPRGPPRTPRAHRPSRTRRGLRARAAGRGPRWPRQRRQRPTPRNCRGRSRAACPCAARGEGLEAGPPPFHAAAPGRRPRWRHCARSPAAARRRRRSRLRAQRRGGPRVRPRPRRPAGAGRGPARRTPAPGSKPSRARIPSRVGCRRTPSRRHVSPDPPPGSSRRPGPTPVRHGAGPPAAGATCASSRSALPSSTTTTSRRPEGKSAPRTARRHAASGPGRAWLGMTTEKTGGSTIVSSAAGNL